LLYQFVVLRVFAKIHALATVGAHVPDALVEVTFACFDTTTLSAYESLLRAAP
jgi:hypothetical protein